MVCFAMLFVAVFAFVSMFGCAFPPALSRLCFMFACACSPVASRRLFSAQPLFVCPVSLLVIPVCCPGLFMPCSAMLSMVLVFVCRVSLDSYCLAARFPLPGRGVFGVAFVVSVFVFVHLCWLGVVLCSAFFVCVLSLC